MNNISRNSVNPPALFSDEKEILPPCANQKETGRFIGFSKQDALLKFFIETGVCDEEGHPNETLAGCIFDKIQNSHAIYPFIRNLIDPIKDPLSILTLANELVDESRKENRGVQQHKISDVQITGSEVRRILFKYPDLLIDAAEKIFRGIIPLDRLRKLIEELAKKHQLNQSHAGDETDVRIICPTANKEYLAHLTSLARKIFERQCLKNPLQPLGSLKSFSKINDETTLIGFYCHGKLKEYTMTSKPTNLSSDTCGSISILNDEYRFQFLGFSLAGFLVHELSGCYVPRSIFNFQSWMRLMYYSDLIPMGNIEKQMIDQLLKPLELITSPEEFTTYLRELRYPAALISKYPRAGTFTLSQDRMLAQYLYFLIQRRIQTKIDDKGKPPSDDSHALFTFRCCQSLKMYGKISRDEVVVHLFNWLEEDGLLTYPSTHLLLRFLTQAIRQKQLSFSICSATTTLMAWLYQPETFTRRQNPPIFFVHEPFILRIPTDLSAALGELVDYVKKGGEVEKIKQIHSFFLSTKKQNRDYQQKICEELDLNPDSIGKQIDFLFNHADPFICLLGLELKLIFDLPKNDFSPFEKLPLLLQSELDSTLIEMEKINTPFLPLRNSINLLHEHFVKNFGNFECLESDLTSLSGWIELFIRSNNPPLILLAYRLQKKNKRNSDENLNFILAEALSTHHPLLALKLLSSGLKPPADCSLKMLFNIIYSSQIISDMLHEEIFPFFENLLLDPTCDFTNKRGKLSIDPVLNFINKIANREKQRFLVLGLILRGYFNIEELPENLKTALKPISLFLMQRKNLGFTASTTERILSFFKPENRPDIPEEVIDAWAEILTWVFYPNLIGKEKTQSLKALQQVNEYLKSDKCNLKALHDLQCALFIDEHTDSHTDICKDLEADELKLFQEIHTLLQHEDPLVSYVGFQTGLNLSNLKNINVFILQLPKILNGPSHHQEALEGLFKRIADRYQLDVQILNPALLEDWIKLLARTKDVHLIDLAFHIWKENREQTPENMDLLLFQALAAADPNLALHHFCDMHAQRKPNLTRTEYVKCLSIIESAYQKKPLKIGFKRLIPILYDVVVQRKSWQNSVKIKFSQILIFFIQNMEKSDPVDELLLKAISNELISPRDLDEEKLKFIFSRRLQAGSSDKKYREDFQKTCLKIGQFFLIQKDPRCCFLLDLLISEKEISSSLPDVFHQFLMDCLKQVILNIFPSQEIHPLSRLKKLIQIAPPGKSKETAAIVKEYLELLLKSDQRTISYSDVLSIDELFVKHQDLLVQIKDWNQKLHSYLNHSPFISDREHFYLLFSFLLNPSTPLSEISLLRTLALPLDKKFPDLLPLRIQNYLTSRNETPIEIFKNTQEWTIAQTYIRLYNFYRLASDRLVKNTWQICFEVSKIAEFSILSLLDLLATQNQKSWQGFFTGEKEHLCEIAIVLNRFFKEAQQHPVSNLPDWISLLINIYIQSGESKDLMVDCHDDDFLYVTNGLLSPFLKKYLFLNKKLLGDQGKKIIRDEIKSEIHLDKADLSFCLELSERYFKDDLEFRLSIFKAIHNSKDTIAIECVIHDLEGINAPSDDLVDCWISMFRYLETTLHPKIWDYLNSLPSVFSLEEQSKMKKHAESILIRGAASSLRHQNSSTLSKRKSNGKFNEEMLLTRLYALSEISSGLYFLVFSSLGSDYLIFNPKECLILIGKASISGDFSGFEGPFTLLEFKTNLLNLLKQYLNPNNFELIQQGLGIHGPIDCIAALEFCLKLSIKLGIIHKKNSHEYFFLFKEISNDQSAFANSFFSPSPSVGSNFLNLLDEIYKRFFDFYESYSSVIDLKKDTGQALALPPIFLLNQTINLSRLECLTSEQKDFLLRLIAQGFSQTLPIHFDNFSEEYFENLLKTIFHLKTSLDNESVLKKAIFHQISNILLNSENNTKSFKEAKKMFEKGIEWEINSAYSTQFVQEKFKLLFKTLWSIKALKSYHSDEWLFTQLNLIATNEKQWWHLVKTSYVESAGLSPLKKEKIYNEIIKKLLNYKTPVGLKGALLIYFFNANFTIINKYNSCLNIFKTILEDCSKHNVFSQGHSILSYIYRTYFREIPVQDSPFSSKKNKLLQNHFDLMLECLLDTTLNYIEGLKLTSIEFHKIAHYLKLCFEIIDHLLDRKFFENKKASYLLKLEKLLDPVTEIESWYLANLSDLSSELSSKLSNEVISIDIPPHMARRIFTEKILLSCNSDSAIQLKQNELLEKFILKLTRVETLANPHLESGKYLFLTDCFFDILMTTSHWDQEMVRQSIQPALEFLNNSDLTEPKKNEVNLIKYHFERPHSKQEIESFQYYSKTLFHSPMSESYWDCTYFVLNFRVKAVFGHDPQNDLYRETCLNFHSSLLNFSHDYRTEEAEIKVVYIISFLYSIITFKLFELSDRVCMLHFSFIQNWFTIKKLDQTPLNLALIMLNFVQMTQEEKYRKLSAFIPEFAKWFEKTASLSPDSAQVAKTYLKSLIDDVRYKKELLINQFKTLEGV